MPPRLASSKPSRRRAPRQRGGFHPLLPPKDRLDILQAMMNDDNASAQFTKSSTFVVSVVTEVLDDGNASVKTIQLPGIGTERIKYILTTPRDGDQDTLGTQNLMVGTLVPASAQDAKKSRERYLATSLFTPYPQQNETGMSVNKQPIAFG